jgi:hypothetical protein
MPTPKLNPSRSIAVIPSDDCNIPNPALLITNSATTSNVLAGSCTLSVAEEIISSINIGDIIYGDGKGVTIETVSIVSANDIDVTYNSSATFTDSTTVSIYNGEDDSTGCVLYIGGAGALSVTTEGGDDVVFSNIPDGTFFPVQVIKVKYVALGASDILALR